MGTRGIDADNAVFCPHADSGKFPTHFPAGPYSLLSDLMMPE